MVRDCEFLSIHVKFQQLFEGGRSNVPAPDEKDEAVVKAYREWKDKDSNCLSFLRVVTALDIRKSISEAECDTCSRDFSRLQITYKIV